jgi:hypothetical protein
MKLTTGSAPRGGISFLARAGGAFFLVLLAQGGMPTGLMANRIFYEGATLQEFKVPFTLRTAMQLAAGTLLSVVLLSLTVMPLEQFLDKLPKIVF